LRGSSPIVLALLVVALAGCATREPQPDPTRVALLENVNGHLHERLEKAAAADPLVAAAVAGPGQIVLAMRSGLIEELAGTVARSYLDRVTVDLGDVEGHGSGEMSRKTFLGRLKVGEWNVSVGLGDLTGHLRAGTPRVSLRGPDLVDVELPVDVQETEGNASLHFSWDSSGLANLVCKDFELVREIRGRVLAQRHVVSGALRLHNTGDGVTATPVFPDRRILLKLDLTSRSWGVVEAALRSQDTAGKCGTLMDPAKGLVHLRALATKGIPVRLPDSIFRSVTFPARLHEEVKVNERPVGLRLTAESLRVKAATLWTSVSVQVQARSTP
jgi:hypothetical protein